MILKKKSQFSHIVKAFSIVLYFFFLSFFVYICSLNHTVKFYSSPGFPTSLRLIRESMDLASRLILKCLGRNDNNKTQNHAHLTNTNS